MVGNLKWETFNLNQAVFKAPMPEPSMITIEPKIARTISIYPEPKWELPIGAVLFLLGILAGVWFWRKRWHRQKAAKCSGAIQAVQDYDRDEKKAASTLGLESRRAMDVELEGDQHHAVEMHAPLKTHEMAHSNADNVHNDIVHEMPGTSRTRT